MDIAGISPIGLPMRYCPPKEGARAFPFTVDFSTQAIQDFDFTAIQATSVAKVSMIETIFINNSGNASVLDIAIGSEGSTQIITVPAHGVGYIPVLAPNPPKFQLITTPAADLSVQVVFLNFAVPPIMWTTA